MPVPIIAAVISTVGGVIAAKIASGGNTKAAETNAAASDKAAEIQSQTADKALAQAKDIYEQQRADEGPYREGGYNSLNALNYGLGLPAVSYQAPASATPTPTNLPSSTINGVTFPGAPQVPDSTVSGLNALGQRGGMTGNLAQQVAGKVNNAQNIVNQTYAGSGPTTKVKAPNGLVYLVPNDKVDAAKQAGGVVV